MPVLVVEDDRALGLFLQKGLELQGHKVHWVGDGESVLSLVEELRPRLVVLDLSLPRRDGTDVLIEMHERYPETSVLVLTGRSGLDERIRCLNLGADDCLLKPFSFHELVARVHAVLRRKENFADPMLRYGTVEMNRMSREVWRDGREIELTGKEFALLEFMLKRGGGCCARTELLRDVWQMAPDAGTNVVDVYINYLRKKLSAAHPDGTQTAPVIETVRGEGYRLVHHAKTVLPVSMPAPLVHAMGA